MWKINFAPYFDYCSCVWASTSKGLSDKLQRLQNRSARIIKQANYETRSSDLLNELGWEKLEDRRINQLAVTMYKINNDLSPSYLKNIFTQTMNKHSYNLRNSSINLHVPRPHSEAGKSSFHYRGASLWNKIPAEVRTQSNVISFKKQLNIKELISGMST